MVTGSEPFSSASPFPLSSPDPSEPPSVSLAQAAIPMANIMASTTSTHLLFKIQCHSLYEFLFVVLPI
jgi:hypothetical protein